MGSVVTYTLSKCVKCMKCIKSCPTSALSMNENRIKVNHERCINCGTCIKECHSQGIVAKGSTLYDIDSYDYSVCIVPSSLINDCHSAKEVEELFYAIKLLGFDEVVDITDIEGQVLHEAHIFAKSNQENSLITSFCPLVNRLIEVKYPMLLNSIIPLDYPSEIAAREIRKKYKDKGTIGIFNCCECEAKLALAKYPYGNTQYEVDHALSIVDIFPFIKQNRKKGSIPVQLCKEGLQSCNPSSIVNNDNELVADGFDKINNILGLAEFGLLNQFQLLTLFPCFNGCLGGHLLWGNSYLTKNNIYSLCEHEKEISQLEFDSIYSENIAISINDSRTFQEKMVYFAKVNEQLEHLPGYDCTACGLPTCRIMAEEIAKGNKQLMDCKIIQSMEDKNEGK